VALIQALSFILQNSTAAAFSLASSFVRFPFLVVADARVFQDLNVHPLTASVSVPHHQLLQKQEHPAHPFFFTPGGK
jgi:hypothetical protein